jgi:hypothetical protein
MHCCHVWDDSLLVIFFTRLQVLKHNIVKDEAPEASTSLFILSSLSATYAVNLRLNCN